MKPKMFLSPQTYNSIYSESSGILITTKLPPEPTEHVKAKNKKLREENSKMKRTLEFLAEQYKDTAIGALAREAIKEQT
jgi:hypothetical protein